MSGISESKNLRADNSRDMELLRQRHFFEGMVYGLYTPEELLARTSELGIELQARNYSVAFVSAPLPGSDEWLRESLVSHFLKYPEYILIHWAPDTLAVLIKSNGEPIEGLIERCIRKVQELNEKASHENPWHIALSSTADELAELPHRFRQLRELWATRFVLAGQHILRPEPHKPPPDFAVELPEPDLEKLSPDILRLFLQEAELEAIPGFVDNYLSALRDCLRSRAFCQYLMLNIRYTAANFVRSLELSPRELLDSLKYPHLTSRSLSPGEMKLYMSEILNRTIELRDKAAGRRCGSLIQGALGHIEARYQSPRLSLSSTAEALGVSPNYLSAIFSREMERSFIEYVTAKRMAKARDLLRSTALRSAEIAQAVGYNDSHYFSTLFKKLHGCTPRDYRRANTLQTKY